MNILVDFDNVLPHMRREGLLNFSSRVVNAIAHRKQRFESRCRLRLYGGWYEHRDLTRQAEELITDIGENFPGVITWSTNKDSGRCLAHVELARSLEVQPGRDLYYTQRTRDFSDQVRCDERKVRSCSESDCPMRLVSELFRQKKCPNARCRTTPADILSKQEQKLTDTMITADLIHLAKSGQLDLAVVSSDDDLWPGIQVALLYGARVIQVHTRSGRPTPAEYTTGLAQYKDASL